MKKYKKMPQEPIAQAYAVLIHLIRESKDPQTLQILKNSLQDDLGLTGAAGACAPQLQF